MFRKKNGDQNCEEHGQNDQDFEQGHGAIPMIAQKSFHGVSVGICRRLVARPVFVAAVRKPGMSSTRTLPSANRMLPCLLCMPAVQSADVEDRFSIPFLTASPLVMLRSPDRNMALFVSLASMPTKRLRLELLNAVKFVAATREPATGVELESHSAGHTKTFGVLKFVST